MGPRLLQSRHRPRRCMSDSSGRPRQNSRCIIFKTANITFYTLHSSQPACLHSALHTHHSTYSLTLSNTNLLSVTFVCTLLGSFNVAAPKNLELSPSSSEYLPAPTLFVVMSRLTISSRPFNLLSAFILVPQIQLVDRHAHL